MISSPDIDNITMSLYDIIGGGTGGAGGALPPKNIYDGGHCPHILCSSSMPEQYGNIIIRQKTYLNA